MSRHVSQRRRAAPCARGARAGTPVAGDGQDVAAEAAVAAAAGAVADAAAAVAAAATVVVQGAGELERWLMEQVVTGAMDDMEAYIRDVVEEQMEEEAWLDGVAPGRLDSRRTRCGGEASGASGGSADGEPGGTGTLGQGHNAA